MSHAMSTKRCKACIYSGYLTSQGIICDYRGKVGHMRPCPPGDDCTVRKTGQKLKAEPWATKARRWDTAKATELRAQGMSYPAIAKELGTTKAAVAIYFGEKRKKEESDVRKVH